MMEQTRVALMNAKLRLAERRNELTVLLGLSDDHADWTVQNPLPQMPGESIELETSFQCDATGHIPIAGREKRGAEHKATLYLGAV